MLSDGNRIERRFTTSMARDGRGRTRSEQEVAMLGPLTVLQKGTSLNWTSGQPAAGAPGEPPRFTVITDPVDGVTYTLDERTKEARRNPAKIATQQFIEVKKLADKIESRPRRWSQPSCRRITRHPSGRRHQRRGHKNHDDDSGRPDREFESHQSRHRTMVLERAAHGGPHHTARPSLW
jgi:hypothetical protein